MNGNSGTLPLPGIISVWAQIRCTGLVLLLFGFRRTYHLASLFGISEDSCGDPGLAEARKISAQVKAVTQAYLLFGASCLEESLVLWRILRRKGFDADLRLGVRTITGRFESHAWVEHRGEVLNDHPDIRQIYAPMPLPWERKRP